MNYKIVASKKEDNICIDITMSEYLDYKSISLRSDPINLEWDFKELCVTCSSGKLTSHAMNMILDFTSVSWNLHYNLSKETIIKLIEKLGFQIDYTINY